MANKRIKYPEFDNAPLMFLKTKSIYINYPKMDEENQIKLIKSFDYRWNYDYFVKKNIKYDKALELYEKLKKVRNIIK
jgi:uncharacterized protein (UPF0332 family)